MPKLTPEKEILIRQAIKSRIESLADLAVFEERKLISSKQDFVAKTTRIVAGKKAVRFCQIDFLSFTDSDSDGCEDDPVVVVSYRLHAFYQFNSDSGATNSLNNFIKLVLDVRNSFLSAPTIFFGDPNTQLKPLEQASDILTGLDPFIDLDGHFVDLTAQVELQ